MLSFINASPTNQPHFDQEMEMNTRSEHELSQDRRESERSDQLTGNDGYQQHIAEAAYFKAKRRNFEPGNELDDWLQAEAELKGFLLSNN